MTRRTLFSRWLHAQRIAGICIANPDADCEHCELNAHLICNFPAKLANTFLWGNVLYRLLAILITLLTGWLTGQWWTSALYIVAVFVTFGVVEPRLLCSHCPFYAKEGTVLSCWALRGMPKLWRYRPEPISRSEKTLMLAFGGFIDLFPFAVAAYGIIVSLISGLKRPQETMAFAGLILITVGFTVLAGILDKFLRGGACKRCPNFSCAMNRVPDDIRNAFLQKNPTMKAAWEARH